MWLYRTSSCTGSTPRAAEADNITATAAAEADNITATAAAAAEADNITATAAAAEADNIMATLDEPAAEKDMATLDESAYNTMDTDEIQTTVDTTARVSREFLSLPKVCKILTNFLKYI